ncbi:MAG: hypothetical protein FWG87_05415 [Defluviitaleaceae bacterium]|nr:hypothetical protein [Defluviitaleaceae bacterium]
MSAPEVCTFCNSGRITSSNAGRGNLGTDKSVPYETPRVIFIVCYAAFPHRGTEGAWHSRSTNVKKCVITRI